MNVNWTDKERRAWAWPEDLTPSQWAERYRILGGDLTSEPGPWRGERTPYLAGIVDAVAEPGVEEVCVLKGAQIGFSESVRNILGWLIDWQPGPTLIVMPDQKSAEELITERVKPLLVSTPEVARHLTDRAWDVKKSAIRLDSMSIYLGWAGSSQALKSRPIQNLFLEEPDEYPTSSGDGGDPISKAMKRVTTYAAKGRARVLMGGTPTTREKHLWRFWESCGDQRMFHVPCPHCGTYQELVWSKVKYLAKEPDETRAHHSARLLDTRDSAWYECACGGKILDSQKPDMLRRGVWAGRDQVVTPDGRVAGPSRRHKRIGFKISAVYSPWVSFSRLASEWVESQDIPEKLADFVNQRLAEPFERQVLKITTESVRERKGGAPLIPKDFAGLYTTVDTQMNSFYLRVRWWGHGFTSGGVYRTICRTFDEVYQLGLQTPFAIEGGGTAMPSHLLIDSGGTRREGDADSRTNEVYQFALRDPGRIVACKGSSHQMRKPFSMTQLPNGVALRLLDTEYFKDMLARLMNDKDKGKWAVEADADEDYFQQMASEHKIHDRKSGLLKWVKVTQGAANHWLDTEMMQCAAAEMGNLGGIAGARRAQAAPAQHMGERVSVSQWASGGKRW